MTENQQIKFYKVLRKTIFVIFSIMVVGFSLFSHSDAEKDRAEGAFLIIISFPIITPFLYSWIYQYFHKIHLYLYLVMMLVFMLVAAVPSPDLSSFFFLIFLGSAGFSFLVTIAVSHQKKSQAFFQNSHFDRENEPASTYVEQAYVEDSTKNQLEKPLSTIDKINQKLEKIDIKLQQYEVQLRMLEHEKQKRDDYLSEVEERLKFVHLSEENRSITEQLKEGLLSSQENYVLLIRFFSEARNKFIVEQENLKSMLSNLEIINFLKKDSHMANIREVEKALLQMEFEEHIKELEEEIPILSERMQMDSIDLSQDMKVQLEDAIRKLV